ncbi:MAG TPA: precorrin-6y C5,15-methyltransferase (decarboxylating) subunit CbiE [Nitrososphaeraceae archaeon]
MSVNKKLYLVGVGPGSSKYIPEIIKDIITKSNYVIGYEYTLKTISHLINKEFQKVYQITMNDQDNIYVEVLSKMEDGQFCTVPFTGDVNFSESEVVDRLLEIFGEDNVEVIPGISSIQVAASKAKIPLDKSTIISFHVTEDIEDKKQELLNAVRHRRNVILLPRPWNNNPIMEFMQSDIAIYLKKNGIKTSELDVWVFEFLTTSDEQIFKGKLNELEDMKFDPLSVMVIDQVERRSYMDFN